jgi:hypothetical protein
MSYPIIYIYQKQTAPSLTIHYEEKTWEEPSNGPLSFVIDERFSVLRVRSLNNGRRYIDCISNLLVT